MRKQDCQSAKMGFTLIEIIAVLVILGIIAIVAIPRYQDLKDEAAKKSAEATIAAVQSACSKMYSKSVMTAPETYNTWECNSATLPQSEVSVSEGITWNVSSSGGTTNITVTLEGVSATGEWVRP